MSHATSQIREESDKSSVFAIPRQLSLASFYVCWFLVPTYMKAQRTPITFSFREDASRDPLTLTPVAPATLY
eukprot:8881824-Pyramimonas_sp.AAC.1